MKFVYMTDQHITNKWPQSRLDNYLETILNKVEWVIQFANQEDAYILLGGDLVDRYTCSPEVVNKIISIFRTANKPIFGIVGNHDVYAQNFHVLDNVILGTVFKSGIVNLLTADPIFITEDNMVVQLTGANYIPDMEKHKELYQPVRCPDSNWSIHIIHSFLIKKHWETLKRQYTLITEVNSSADIILAGHEHQGFGVVEDNGTIFINPGSLGRISSSLTEIARKPCIALIELTPEGRGAQIIEVPCAPDGNDVLSRELIEVEKARKEHLNTMNDLLTIMDTTIGIADIFETRARIDDIAPEVKILSKRAIEVYEEKLSSGRK